MTTEELLDRHHAIATIATDLRADIASIQGQLQRKDGPETWRRSAQQALGVKRRRLIQARSEMKLIRSLMETTSIRLQGTTAQADERRAEDLSCSRA
jgi:hypothetical protein